MHHTIIIPHRNRNRHLELCLWSIARSIEAVGVRHVEVLVVEHGSDVKPTATDRRVRVIVDERPMPAGTITTRIGTVKHYENAFCKSRLLNLGIEQAQGDVITILDADAVVGLMWASGATLLSRVNIHRVCYRVRYIEKGEVAGLLNAEVDRDEEFNRLFRQYDRHCLAWEAYGHPAKNAFDSHAQPWGNSQFSMRRSDIGDLRFDERYIGKGLEDIDFNRQVYEKLGVAFRGVIFTQPDYAMFHLRHDYDQDRWSDPAFQIANCDRYNGRLE